jgi:hypothetical protein
MKLELTITPHETYIHVHVCGIGNAENAEHLWRSVVQACEQYQIYKVLGEQYLLDSVSTAEAFDHPALFKKVGITKKHKLAWVDNNPRTRDTTRFVRDVLTNRSIGYGRLFDNVDNAKRWLLQQE